MPKFSLYNTRTKAFEEVKPIADDGMLRVYCCGPTVYNYPHVGNMRAFIWEDILVRSLRQAGFNVKHVMNITDVGHLTSDEDTGEDKIRIAAEREKMTVYDIARKYENIFFDYSRELNIKRPDIVCRATDYVEDMISMVKTLEDKGYAYFSGGNVYFDTAKFPNYGKMAGLKLTHQEAGSRVEEDKNKRNPSDFVLWFTDSKFKNQILVWPSPWGEVGYPGWHIECSAMAIKELGEYLDIHCGGVDHIGVHHTNEIAQSEAYLGHQWCNMWIHGEFLNLSGGKMSKSAGGFITLDSIKEKGYNPMHFRYLCLTAHYRSMLEFSEETLQAARNTYENLCSRVIELRKQTDGSSVLNLSNEKSYVDKFYGHMYSDLATPQALSAMWELLKNNSLSAGTRLSCLEKMDEILGLGIVSMVEEAVEIPEEVKALIEERKKAREEKNWKKSDELRDRIKEEFFLEVKDLPGGQFEIRKS